MEHLEHDAGEQDDEDMNFDFNLPEELIEIFRIPPGTEMGGKALITWESVKAVKEYPYIDDWEKYKGPKFYIDIHQDMNNMLVMGEYERFKNKWFKFRSKHRLFRTEDED